MVQEVKFAGRPWMIRFVTRPEFEQASGRWFVPLILVMGGLLSLTLFAIARSQVRAVLAGRRNMEELEHSQRRLLVAKDTAELANQAKDNFLAMLSHELRTPLAPVLATAGLWGDDPTLPPEVRADMRMIERNIRVEARLIDDLLDLTRVTRGKVQLQVEVVDVHEVLRHSIAVCASRRDEKDVMVELHLDATRHHVQADPARMQQIFSNLVQNAVKFMPDGGTLTARTANEENWIRVELSDTGIGIDPNTMARLFEPFEQGEIPARRFGGLGLGLSIVKGLVEAHGGRVEARSAGAGRGATFTLWLATAPLALIGSGTHEDRPARRGKKLRVMVVEDHPDTLRAMIRLLRSFGHEVSSATTGKDALALCKQQPFDVLISDIGLPDMSGYELLAELRSCAKNATFKGIALTGFGMPEDVQRAREAGFDAHLTKPIDPATLEATIEKLAQVLA